MLCSVFGALLYFYTQKYYKFLCISPKLNFFVKYVKGSKNGFQRLWKPPEVKYAICT